MRSVWEFAHEPVRAHPLQGAAHHPTLPLPRGMDCQPAPCGWLSPVGDGPLTSGWV